MPIKHRVRNLYDPTDTKPFKLSRTKLENFTKCPRCFYLDRRLGIARPSTLPFTLNSAVDHLLKKEFDQYRIQQKPHPLMVEHKLNAIPYQHSDLETWRANFQGLQFHHKPTNFIITGAIDDLWINPNQEIIIVDYKATSKDGEVTLEDEWKESYKRQMEIYQWIMRKMGFKVSNTGYFVYANGRKDPDRFDQQLQFHLQLIPYDGSDTWVEPSILKAHECLISDLIPPPTTECEHCQFVEMAKSL